MTALAKRPFFWVMVFGLAAVVLFLLPRHLTSADQQLTEFEAKWKLGAMHMQQARIPMEGIQLLAKAAREHPEHPEAAAQLGMMAMNTGQYQKAIGWYRQSFQHAADSDKPYVLTALSDAYFAAKMPDSARWALKKVFDYSSDSVLLRSVNKQLNELNILSN